MLTSETQRLNQKNMLLLSRHHDNQTIVPVTKQDSSAIIVTQPLDQMAAWMVGSGEEDT